VALIKRAYRSRLVQTMVPLAVLLVALGIMARLIVHEYGSIERELRSLQPDLVIVSLAAAVAATLGGGVLWKFILAACEVDLPLTETLRIWCLSTPAKYGLGAISQYAGRVYLAERAGIPHRTALISLVMELGLIILSGLVVLLILVPLGGSVLLPGIPPSVLTAGPVVGILIVAFLPVVVCRTMSIMPSQWNRDVVLRAAPRARLALLVVVVNWLLLGSTCFLLAAAMTPVAPTLYPFFVFAVVLAVLSGLLAVTPLGLGVRDVVLAVALALVIPAPLATAAALLHRLTNVVAEFICAGAVLGLSSRDPRRRVISRVNRPGGD